MNAEAEYSKQSAIYLVWAIVGCALSYGLGYMPAMFILVSCLVLFLATYMFQRLSK